MAILQVQFTMVPSHPILTADVARCIYTGQILRVLRLASLMSTSVYLISGANRGIGTILIRLR